MLATKKDGATTLHVTDPPPAGQLLSVPVNATLRTRRTTCRRNGRRSKDIAAALLDPLALNLTVNDVVPCVAVEEHPRKHNETRFCPAPHQT